MLRFSNVKKSLSERGVQIRFDREWGDYSVKPFGNDHPSYFTDDLEDAYYTGIKIASDL